MNYFYLFIVLISAGWFISKSEEENHTRRTDSVANGLLKLTSHKISQNNNHEQLVEPKNKRKHKALFHGILGNILGHFHHHGHNGYKIISKSNETHTHQSRLGYIRRHYISLKKAISHALDEKIPIIDAPLHDLFKEKFTKYVWMVFDKYIEIHEKDPHMSTLKAVESMLPNVVMTLLSTYLEGMHKNEDASKIVQKGVSHISNFGKSDARPQHNYDEDIKFHTNPTSPQPIYTAPSVGGEDDEIDKLFHLGNKEQNLDFTLNDTVKATLIKKPLLQPKHEKNIPMWGTILIVCLSTLIVLGGVMIIYVFCFQRKCFQNYQSVATTELS